MAGETIGLAANINQYFGKNKNGQYQVFSDNNLQEALPGSITAANMNGTEFSSTTPSNGMSEGITDKFARWFTPQGTAGTSVGGNIMGAVGTGIGAATGLAGAYYAKKNYDLQKDQQKYLQARDAQNDARKAQFAANAGGGASY